MKVVAGYYLIACLSLLLASVSAVAEPVKDLYQAEVLVVNNQSSEQRSESMRAALLQVLSRLVQSKVLKGAKLKAILAKPDAYVSQYRYLRRTEAEDANQRLLQVVFNPAAVKHALKAKGLAAWGADRPSVLVWLLEVDQKQWFKADVRLQWRQALTAAAKKQGLPLLLPLMDLTDRQSLVAVDTALNDQVLQASKRYKPEATLFGRLSASGADVRDVHWTLFYAGEVQQWTAKQQPLTGMMESGTQGAYERMVLRKTVVTAPVVAVAGPGKVILRVSGVEDIHAFTRVTTYLKSVRQLRSQWLRVTPDELWFELKPRAGVARLRQRLDSGGVFKPVYTQENAESVLHYRLSALPESAVSISADY